MTTALKCFSGNSSVNCLSFIINCFFLIQIVGFLVPTVMNNFKVYPGHIDYYIMLLILFKILVLARTHL